MFPRSVEMLEHVIRTSPRENDVMFAGALLPVFANSEQPALTAKAFDVLRALEGHAGDFGSYQFRRELFRAPAEAGDRRYLTKVISLVTGKKALNSELVFLEGYGWHRRVLEKNIARKLTHLPCEINIF